jgi:serine phosphatase RsbU (regulator of sigma subunit)
MIRLGFCIVLFFHSFITLAQVIDSSVLATKQLNEALIVCKEDSCKLNNLFKLHYLQLKTIGELTEKNVAQFNLSYAKQAIVLAEKLGKYDTLKSLTVDLGYVFDLEKKFDSSFVYYSNCLNIFEYTNNYQLTFSIAQNILYNNSMLQSIIEENNKKAIEQKRKIDNLTYAVIAALIGLMLFMVYFIIKTRQNNRLLQTQKDVIEHSKNEIDASINYAQNLQHAILSNELKLKQQLSNAFVLFMPRDKVSGDFFWAYKKGDDLYMAVADCTGHGVPGALLSIVGYLLLDKILSDDMPKTPSEILDELHLEIVKALDQEKGIHNRDGMDIALLKLNTSTNQLQFSGAHRPLYLIRNGELTEYKGTRRPIGGTQVKYDKPFVNIDIQLQKDDLIYSYSDGYADQIGGPNGKKMLSGNLKKFIFDNSHLPSEEQREKLRTTFIDYKGNYKQTDDVLMLGFKI